MHHPHDAMSPTTVHGSMLNVGAALCSLLLQNSPGSERPSRRASSSDCESDSYKKQYQELSKEFKKQARKSAHAKHVMSCALAKREDENAMQAQELASLRMQNGVMSSALAKLESDNATQTQELASLRMQNGVLNDRVTFIEGKLEERNLLSFQSSSTIQFEVS